MMAAVALGKWLQSRFIFRGRKENVQEAPRRVKTYAAETGFVFRYSFAGCHEEEDSAAYQFQLSDGQAVVIRIAHGPRERELRPRERYAVAKLALFRALDRAASPGDLPPQVTVDEETSAEFLNTLGIGL